MSSKIEFQMHKLKNTNTYRQTFGTTSEQNDEQQLSMSNFSSREQVASNSTLQESQQESIDITAKHSRQSNAVAPAYVIMMAGGAQIAWGICFYFYRIEREKKKYEYSKMPHIYDSLLYLNASDPLSEYEDWNDIYEDDWLTVHSIISYFIGNFFGSIIAYLYIDNLQKKIFYMLSSALLIISAIFFIINPNSYLLTLAGRYIAGAAVGLSFIPFIFHASEILVKEIRGSRLGGLSMMTIIGMLLMLILGGTISNVQDLNLVCVVFMIAYAVITTIVSLICEIETPMFYMAKGQNDIARISLIRLRNEQDETISIINELQEINAIIEDANLQNRNILMEGNYKPLICVAILRVLYNSSLCLPIMYFLTISFTVENSINTVFALTITIAIRYASEFVAFFITDRLPRRLLLLASSGIGGIALFIGGILWANNKMKIAQVFFCIYSAVIGFGLGSVSLCYLGEAFPRRKKALSILDIVAIEVLALLIGAIFSVYGYRLYITNATPFILSVTQVICGVFLYFKLPETSGLSLRDCYKKMRELSLFCNVECTRKCY